MLVQGVHFFSSAREEREFKQRQQARRQAAGSSGGPGSRIRLPGPGEDPAVRLGGGGPGVEAAATTLTQFFPRAPSTGFFPPGAPSTYGSSTSFPPSSGGTEYHSFPPSSGGTHTSSSSFPPSSGGTRTSSGGTHTSKNDRGREQLLRPRSSCASCDNHSTYAAYGNKGRCSCADGGSSAGGSLLVRRPCGGGGGPPRRELASSSRGPPRRELASLPETEGEAAVSKGG